MAPVNEIREWLTQKSPYGYGVELLSQVHNNRRLILTLMRSENEINLEKVIYELDKWLYENHKNEYNEIQIQQSPKEERESCESKSSESEPSSAYNRQPVKEGAKKELPVISPSNRDRNLANNRNVLLGKVKDKRILLYRERGHLHGRLHEAPDDEHRKDLAFKIIDIQKEIDGANKDLKLIEQGKTPKELVLKMMSGEEYKDYRNTQNYVVRYTNNLKKEGLTADQQKRYSDKLEEYQTKLDNFFN